MKKFTIPALALVALLGVSASPAQAGCLTGAALGAVGGHFVGRGHALAGAAAGCAVGHHVSNVHERNARENQVVQQPRQPVPMTAPTYSR